MGGEVWFGDSAFILFSSYILSYFTCPNSVTFPTNRYEIKSPGRNAFTKWWNGFYANDFLVHKRKLPCKKKILKYWKKVALFLLRKSPKSVNSCIYQQVFTNAISKLVPKSMVYEEGETLSMPSTHQYFNEKRWNSGVWNDT